MSAPEVARAPDLKKVTGAQLWAAARAAAEIGGLTVAEASAIGRMVALVRSRGDPMVDLRRAFEVMAAATTPERARRFALWSPFDPRRLEAECKHLHSRRRAA